MTLSFPKEQDPRVPGSCRLEVGFFSSVDPRVPLQHPDGDVGGMAPKNYLEILRKSSDQRGGLSTWMCVGWVGGSPAKAIRVVLRERFDEMGGGALVEIEVSFVNSINTIKGGTHVAHAWSSGHDERRKVHKHCNMTAPNGLNCCMAVAWVKTPEPWLTTDNGQTGLLRASTNQGLRLRVLTHSHISPLGQVLSFFETTCSLASLIICCFALLVFRRSLHSDSLALK